MKKIRKKQTILLTGGTGFLGANLLRSILIKGFDVVLLLRRSSNLYRISDLLSKVKTYYIEDGSLENLFEDNKIDVVLHCATNYGRKDEGAISVLESNLMLPLKILQLGVQNGITCFVNTDTILDKRISYYSLSKNQFKEWLKMYSHKIVCANVALEHFYGPNDNISKFVTSIMISLLKNEREIQLTEGKQKRDFIYIDDVVTSFACIFPHLAKKEKGFFNYEIGTGKTISIKEMVSLTKSLANNTKTILNFGAIPLRHNEVMESKVDLSNIHSLGWRPKISIKEGLDITLKFERRRMRL